ncbi:uncharacterized protein LOC144167807 [Haemaphysalis longicornis]
MDQHGSKIAVWPAALCRGRPPRRSGAGTATPGVGPSLLWPAAAAAGRREAKVPRQQPRCEELLRACFHDGRGLIKSVRPCDPPDRAELPRCLGRAGASTGRADDGRPFFAETGRLPRCPREGRCRRRHV